jgi:hypothetical protein
VRHIVRGPPAVKLDIESRRPIGSCPGHSRRAVDSPTIATRGASWLSRAVNSRPARSAIRIVSK